MKKQSISAKIISVITCLLLAVVFMPQFSFSAFADDEGGLDNIAEAMADPLDDPFDYTDTAAKKAAAKASFDSSFDLRNVDGKSYVTPVKSQMPFGSCWDFAATSAAESSLLSSGLATDAETLDLSEKHLMYFAATAINDKTNPQNGEGTHLETGADVTDAFDSGGSLALATSFYAAGVGPVFESDDEAYLYRGKNKLVQKEKINGNVVNFAYSPNDDWTLPKGDRFKHDFYLKESFVLPSPAHIDEDTEKYSYNAAGTTAIKEQLMNKRAVGITFCADDASPLDIGNSQKKYISDNWAHYTYKNETGNHGVTIVGWDDNYSRSNFKEGHQPPASMFPDGRHEGATDGGNGAWLVKNSWGSEERPFPNHGMGNWGIVDDETGKHTGYFWLSYYDRSLDNPEAFEFEENDEDINIDQHDFMPINSVLGGEVEEEVNIANVFTAKKTEELKQVGFVSAVPETEVTYKIYLLKPGFTGPTNGTKVAEFSRTYDFGGFHKETITEEDMTAKDTLGDHILIQKGQSYSIVVTQKTANGYFMEVLAAMNKEFTKLQGTSSWAEGVINKKESYISDDNKWYDMGNKSVREAIFSDMAGSVNFDNFPIKGYFTERNDISLRIRGEASLETRGSNKETNLKLEISGPEEDVSVPEISWKLAKGNNDIVSLKTNEADDSLITLTGKKVGSTTLYASVKNYGSLVIPVKVTKTGTMALSISKSSFVYDGKAKKPTLKMYGMDGVNMKKGTDYKLTYKNNIKCGQATVTAVGLNGYDNASKDFFIKPAKGVVSKTAAGKKKLTVTIKSQKKSGITGYQLKYRAKGTSAWKTKNLGPAKTKVVLKSLKKGKKYQVKVRGYVKTKAKGNLYGAFSKVKVSTKIK